MAKENTLSLKEQLDVMLSEYSFGVEQTKRYSSYTDMILNYTFIGVAALLAWTVKEESILTYKLLCLYMTPTVVYITGLMYVYTLYMIGKDECVVVRSFIRASCWMEPLCKKRW